MIQGYYALLSAKTLKKNRVLYPNKAFIRVKTALRALKNRVIGVKIDNGGEIRASLFTVSAIMRT